MMIDKTLYMDIAERIYDNPSCEDEKEFIYDARRPIRIKFALKKWKSGNDNINIRQVMNHIIVMNNCFGSKSTHMISLFCEEYLEELMPFFDYLKYTPSILSFNGKNIATDTITRNKDMIEFIRGL